MAQREHSTNQGRPIGWFGRDVPYDVVDAMNGALRKSLAEHPANATCECPVVEAIAVLYEHGYVVRTASESTR